MERLLPAPTSFLGRLHYLRNNLRKLSPEARNVYWGGLFAGLGCRIGLFLLLGIRGCFLFAHGNRPCARACDNTRQATAVHAKRQRSHVPSATGPIDRCA
jgi:hypothetical protein